jgi:hypothetical protein
MLRKHDNQLEIISVEDDARVPDVYGLERFMEEVNILELEGYYFAPSRKPALGRQKPKTLRDLYGQPFTKSLSEYGEPSELAYKVLQATFRKLSEQGPETDGIVHFSRRELAALVGKKSFGGNQSDQIFTALMQLNGTRISCAIEFKERVGEKWEKKARVVNFYMFPTVAFEGASRGRFARCVIQVDDKILRNFKNRYISYFNWERMQGLDMVGMMLYKRFFRHMANIYREGMDKNLLVIEKNYDMVCSQWLGLKTARKRSLIERQLGKRLEALKACRLLRECRIEERARGQGFKIVGYAGSGFFTDYDSMYLRRLPSQTPAQVGPEPLVYLHDFHKQLGHERKEFSPKEVVCMREMLVHYGDQGVRRFIDFGLKRARETSFDVQWFGGLRTLYEGEWQAIERKRAKAEQAQAAIAACSVCDETGIIEFEEGSVGHCPHDMAKLARIHRQKPIRGFHQA